ncbi:MAG TPA: DNA polymerase Y family protein, partial [Novosphingobium sp.]|nr:DNA polymerase Y family protein [Novosphingobium sp.]
MDVSGNIAPMRGQRRYLALWFPWLPCQRAQGLPDGETAPFALVARVGNALRLAAINAPARAQGLSAGMTLADARARLPDLTTAAHDPAADAAALEDVARRMGRFSPAVMADPPDGVLLDITGCAHLFGGEAGLARAAMIEARFAARHALAHHAAAARALARFGQHAARAAEDVHALPVASLEPGEEVLAGLHRAGLRRLGDLASRPMAPLAARFGEALVERLRAILGQVERPIPLRKEVSPIRADIRFAEPIGRTDDVMEAIEHLLHQ